MVIILWLADWLVAWLLDWLVSWLFDCFISHLLRWLLVGYVRLNFNSQFVCILTQALRRVCNYWHDFGAISTRIVLKSSPSISSSETSGECKVSSGASCLQSGTFTCHPGLDSGQQIWNGQDQAQEGYVSSTGFRNFTVRFQTNLHGELSKKFQVLFDWTIHNLGLK